MPSRTNGLSSVRRDQLSTEGGQARGFCHSLGHGKFGFQRRGQKCHLTSDCVMTDRERKPPACERRGEESANSVQLQELPLLMSPAVFWGRSSHLPLVQMRKLSRRVVVGLPEVTLLPCGRTRFGARSPPTPFQLRPIISSRFH